MRKTTILMIALLVALPAAVVVAGPARNAYLCRTADAGETMKGKVKIKMDREGDLQLFSVGVRKADAGDYDVVLVDPDTDDDTWIGEIAIAEGRSSGKLKFNTRRGDELDTDPVGMRVEVRSGEDTLLTAMVPDPDAPKVRSNAKEKLEVPETDPIDEKAKGFVRLKVGQGAHHLQVVLQKAPSGTWDIEVSDGDEFTKIGDILIEEGDDSGTWKANDRRGDPVPTGAACYADLAGLAIRVVDGEGVILLEGFVPTIESKKGGLKK